MAKNASDSRQMPLYCIVICTALYSYRLRKGYHSDEMLIEFLSGVGEPTFVSDLFEALKPLNFKVTSNDNPAMDDETILTVSSDAGQFEFSKDIWGMAFLLPVKNQAGIFKVNQVLSQNPLFSRTD